MTAMTIETQSMWEMHVRSSSFSSSASPQAPRRSSLHYRTATRDATSLYSTGCSRSPSITARPILSRKARSLSVRLLPVLKGTCFNLAQCSSRRSARSLTALHPSLLRSVRPCGPRSTVRIKRRGNSLTFAVLKLILTQVRSAVSEMLYLLSHVQLSTSLPSVDVLLERGRRIAASPDEPPLFTMDTQYQRQAATLHEQLARDRTTRKPLASGEQVYDETALTILYFLQAAVAGAFRPIALSEPADSS